MSKELKELQSIFVEELASLAKALDISSKKKRIAEIEQERAKPDFWNDTRRAQQLTKEQDQLKSCVDAYDDQQKLLSNIEAMLELAAEGYAPELLKEASDELKKVESALKAMEFQRMLSGPQDKSGAILTINAGAGGTEACDWAAMLVRMYQRWAESRGYKHEIVDFTEGDGAGFRSVTMTINGDFAYGYLKAENGVHRLVRISPFDANKRRHTSFVSVYAIPDIQDDIEIEINTDDLRIDTFRSGGAGGQHVNKTESAVRLTHLPTNTVVACQSERSQHQNKEVAMKLLRAKLYELEMEKKRKEVEAREKAKKRVEWGSQIRSYVMQPYQLVKDHRTDYESGNIHAVLDGELDEFMKKYLLESAIG